MKSKIILLFKIALIFLLFYIIFKKIKIDLFFNTFLSLDIKYAFLIMSLWPIGLLTSSFKWKLLLDEYGIRISHYAAFTIFWIASFFNNFLPSTIGGDSYKFIYMNKFSKNKKGQVVSSIVLDKVVGLLSLVSIVLFFSLFYIHYFTQKLFTIIIFYCILLLFLVASIIFLLFKRMQIPLHFRFEKINKIVKGINILFSFKNKKILFICFVVSNLFIFIGILATYLGFKAFHYDISFVLLCFLMPLINLSGLIPFSINSLGIREGIGVYLFSFFGVKPEVALSVLLINRILLILCSTTGGLKYLNSK